MGKFLRAIRKTPRRIKDRLKGKLSRKNRHKLLHGIPVKGTVISSSSTAIRVSTRNSRLNLFRKLSGKEPVILVKAKEYDLGRGTPEGKATYHIGKRTGKLTKVRAKGSLTKSELIYEEVKKRKASKKALNPHKRKD
ncbi:hypothetical protein KKB11_03305 [Candidatus Micrarchaeota archaeon]|nr:hypothetical protein [Candidatus Micrarchaeota archaeon]